MNRRMKRLLSNLFAVLLVAGLLCSCRESAVTEDAADQQEVRIAVVLPQKDRQAIWENTLKWAAENIRKADIGVKVVYEWYDEDKANLTQLGQTLSERADISSIIGCNVSANTQQLAFALARENEAGSIVDRLESGELPLRVTHNDTKLNNILFDAETRTPLCVIDLDTIMPGSSLYDYGDSIRFGASTAPEDEKDLSKVWCDMELFRAYTQGFLEGCNGRLTPLEVEMLPMGAKLMTLECGIRFLADFLNGDTYFRTQYEGQNLDRARTQFKLVADMESKWDAMHKIVKELVS